MYALPPSNYDPCNTTNTSDPMRTVNRIETYVAVATALLFLQLILGSCRRRSGNFLIQGSLWLAYTLSFPLIAYILGQMVSSPAKNAIYPMWAILLFLAAGCTNSITAYSLEDNMHWKRYLFELCQYFVYLAVILQLPAPIHTVSPFPDRAHDAPTPTLLPIIPIIILLVLLCLVLITNYARVYAGWVATNSSPSKLVADYMRDLVEAREEQEPTDLITMRDCKYLVDWPSQKCGNIPKGPTYRTNLDIDEIITIGKICQTEFDGRLLTTRGVCSQVKHVCLSFALSHLLKRRFFEMECAEADHPQTRKFFLEVLLAGEDGAINYKRAFNIIEVELGFLYDFYFTKYAALYKMRVTSHVVVVLKLISMCFCGLFLVSGGFTINTLDPVIKVGTKRSDVTITIVIMGTLVVVEILQAIIYVTSDWVTVSLACSYTRRGKLKHIQSLILFLRRFNFLGYCRSMKSETNKGKFFDWLNLFGYWQNKMGQSSVIQGCMPVNRYAELGATMDYMINLILSVIFSGKTFKVVPDHVKSEIVSCMHRSIVGVPLRNGKAALEGNGVSAKFYWTLENQNQTKIMLIWHIATEYCGIASKNEGEGNRISGAEKEHIDKYQQVATTLSRYCAYLMLFVPELLPGNSVETQSIFKAVLREASMMLQGKKPSMDIFLKAISGVKSRNNQETIIHDFRGNGNTEAIINIPTGNNGDATIIQDSSENNTEDKIIHVSCRDHEDNIGDTVIPDSSGETSNATITIINITTQDTAILGSGGNSGNDTITNANSNNEGTIMHDSSINNTHDTTINDSSADTTNNTIFIKGLKLGKDLEEMKDDVLRWKVMAEFWAETIVYIAPSNNVKGHMERLAKGGEFLTHVWALLSHAGILNR